MPMDATAYWEQRNQQNADERYKLGLERTATGEGYLASLIGQEKAKDVFSSLDRLARGGSARARRPYLVGEKGPELMVPNQDGKVISNRDLRKLVRRAVPRARGGVVIAGGAPPQDRPLGFRNAGGIKAAAERGADLAAAGAELGAPTSFAGGAGAPTPIGVIRGMKQTYAMDTGGPQLSEFATPTQARQAFNRRESDKNLADIGNLPPEAQGGARAAVREKFGGYEPVEGPRLRLEGAVKTQLPSEQALADERAAFAEQRKAKAASDALANASIVGSQNVSSLNNYVKTTRGEIDKNTEVGRDAEAAAEVARRSGAGGDKAAITHFNERQAIRAYLRSNPFKLPEGYTHDMYLGALAQNPAAWAEMVQEGRKKMVTAPTDSPGTAMQQLQVLGKKMTPDWMTPGYYERTHPK